MTIVRDIASLLTDVTSSTVIGPTQASVRQVTADSRNVNPGALYAAIKGQRHDGFDYIEDAIQAGASVILTDRLSAQLSDKVVYVQVADVPQAFGQICDAYWGHPSSQLQLVGITGTNGKTSTAILLHQLFQHLGFKAGLISTIENRIGESVSAAKYTTPDTASLHCLLWQMQRAGCDYVFMEVSSHAIAQQRIAGLHFDIAVFTNISHDHLDYHGDFKQYIFAKKQLFDSLPQHARALVNADDKRGSVMLQNTAAETFTFALHKWADFRGKLLENSITGLTLLVDDQVVSTSLVGEFNAYNFMAAYGVAMLLGIDSTQALVALSAAMPAAGRLEWVRIPQCQLTGLVDYAHTPDALQKILDTIRAVISAEQRVICVIGCGGDRDKTKRPKMASIAQAGSEVAIFTSDNPRSEDPHQILADMIQGLSAERMRNVLVIADRRQAIRTAVQLAKADDIICVAGKGHESYQEIKGERTDFDDRTVLMQAMQETALTSNKN